MKKLLLITILFTGIVGCFCTDIDPYWNLDDYVVGLADTDLLQLEVGEYEADTLVLNLQSTYTTLASLPLMMNTAYALTCEEAGHKGMDDPITSVEISSSAQFNEYAPGELLNEIIIVNENSYNTESVTRIDDFVSGSKDMGIDYGGGPILDFYITEKPADSLAHQFTVKMGFLSGKTIEKQSESIIWK